jgi:hypothetical protein
MVPIALVSGFAFPLMSNTSSKSLLLTGFPSPPNMHATRTCMHTVYLMINGGCFFNVFAAVCRVFFNVMSVLFYDVFDDPCLVVRV